MIGAVVLLLAVLSPQRKHLPSGRKMVDQERNGDGVLTASELQRREDDWRDRQQVVERCAWCRWSFEGTAAEGRERAAAHREAEHREQLAAASRVHGSKKKAKRPGDVTADDVRVNAELEENRRAKTSAGKSSARKSGSVKHAGKSRPVLMTDDRFEEARRLHAGGVSLVEIGRDRGPGWGYSNAKAAANAIARAAVVRGVELRRHATTAGSEEETMQDNRPAAPTSEGLEALERMDAGERQREAKPRPPRAVRALPPQPTPGPVDAFAQLAAAAADLEQAAKRIRAAIAALDTRAA